VDYQDSLQILGIKSSTATVEDIQAAFRSVVKSAHPDSGGSTEAFLRVLEAKEVAIKLAGAASALPRLEISLIGKDKYRFRQQCPTCSGHIATERCEACYGRNKRCRKCHGEGSIAVMCPTCRNFKYIVIERQFVPGELAQGIVTVYGKRYQAVVV